MSDSASVLNNWSSWTLANRFHKWVLICFIFLKKCSTHAKLRGNNIYNRNSILENNSLVEWWFGWESHNKFSAKPSQSLFCVHILSRSDFEVNLKSRFVYQYFGNIAHFSEWYKVLFSDESVFVLLLLHIYLNILYIFSHIYLAHIFSHLAAFLN